MKERYMVLITDFGTGPVTVFGNRTLAQAKWDVGALAAMAGQDGKSAPMWETATFDGEVHAYEMDDKYGPMPARLAIVQHA